jgi:predicted Zn finger-like uncharacterized protein
MTVKITCPHCDAVLKPAKPLAAGKKVNCPRCGEVFTVRDEEEEEEARPAPARPAKKAVPAKPARPAKPAPPAPPPKKSAVDDDDDGELTYGVIREPEDEEEDKPKVDYVPDLTVKDPRGKAVMVLGMPSNFLLGLSAVICIGALVAVGVFVWKFIFPPEFWVDPGTALTKDATLKKDTNLPKDDPPPPKKREEYSKEEIRKIEDKEDEEKTFCITWAIVSGVVMIYYGVVAMATVKMQNLESYNWAMTAGIMAAVSLIGAPLGIWAISLLRQPDIKAAFEYVPE